MTLPSEFLIFISGTLERIGIPYHVGGSVASSAHGMYRASADIDFVIDPTSEQLELLACALEAEYYLSRPAMAEAFARRSAFNAIHNVTSFKLDFFLKGTDPFDSEELRRSITQEVGSDPRHSIQIKSAEDTILRKLQWYRDGGSVSDRQWQDVLAILASMRGSLDEAHLDRWARELGVTDLLDEARRDVSDL